MRDASRRRASGMSQTRNSSVREVRMRADVPPDLLGVVDAVGLDQQVDEVLELAPTGVERVGDVGARELVEDLAAVRLAARSSCRARTASWRRARACAAGSSARCSSGESRSRDPRRRRGRAGRRSGWRAPPSACPRRPGGSARRDRSPARASRRTGACRRRRGAARSPRVSAIIWRRRSSQIVGALP